MTELQKFLRRFEQAGSHNSFGCMRLEEVDSEPQTFRKPVSELPPARLATGPLTPEELDFARGE